jgi:hypothetical protein
MEEVGQRRRGTSLRVSRQSSRAACDVCTDSTGRGGHDTSGGGVHRGRVTATGRCVRRRQQTRHAVAESSDLACGQFECTRGHLSDTERLLQSTQVTQATALPWFRRGHSSCPHMVDWCVSALLCTCPRLSRYSTPCTATHVNGANTTRHTTCNGHCTARLAEAPHSS